MNIRNIFPALAMVAAVVGVGVVGFNAQADNPDSDDSWIAGAYSGFAEHRDPTYIVEFNKYDPSGSYNKVTAFEPVYGVPPDLYFPILPRDDWQVRLYIAGNSGYNYTTVNDDNDSSTLHDGAVSLTGNQNPDNPLQTSVSFHATIEEGILQTPQYTESKPTEDSIVLNMAVCDGSTGDLEAYWRAGILDSSLSEVKVAGQYREYGEEDWITFDADTWYPYIMDDMVWRGVSTTTVETGKTYEVRAILRNNSDGSVREASEDVITIECEFEPTPTEEPTPTVTPTPTPTPSGSPSPTPTP